MSFTSPGHTYYLGFLFWHLWTTHPPRARQHMHSSLQLTNPCAKRKVLSLTNPKSKIYKTKSHSHYITLLPHLSLSLTDSLPSLNLLCYSKTDARFMQNRRKAVWSIPYVSVAFFPSLKHNFIAYRSSKLSSRPDCIFEIHQQWQSGFSRVYSNCCCRCSFESEIIKIGQSSHKTYNNYILKFQDFTTILNQYKKVWKLIEITTYLLYMYRFGFCLVLWHIKHCGLFNAKSIFIHIKNSVSSNSV